MQRIGDIAGAGRWEHGSTGLAGREYPDLEDGMPVDRTICPKCLGHGGAGCDVCRGYAVCPDCRGAGVVSAPSQYGVPRYVACPGCSDPWDGEDGKIAGTWPRRLARLDRKRARIAAYQAERQRPRRAPDPWETEAIR